MRAAANRTRGGHIMWTRSADDGATWTTAVLAAAGSLADGTKTYEAIGIDISGQPSGTDMRYRIETDNAKDVEIHGAILKWG